MEMFFFFVDADLAKLLVYGVWFIHDIKQAPDIYTVDADDRA